MPEKIAVLTGASRGLGRRIALHLARAGVSIIGTYHSCSRADSGPAGGHPDEGWVTSRPRPAAGTRGRAVGSGGAGHSVKTSGAPAVTVKA